jgi:hypothetical protein
MGWVDDLLRKINYEGRTILYSEFTLMWVLFFTTLAVIMQGLLFWFGETSAIVMVMLQANLGLFAIPLCYFIIKLYGPNLGNRGTCCSSLLCPGVGIAVLAVTLALIGLSTPALIMAILGITFFFYPGFVLVATIITVVYLFYMPDNIPIVKRYFGERRQLWNWGIVGGYVGYSLIITLAIIIEPLRPFSFFFSVLVFPGVLFFSIQDFPNSIFGDDSPEDVRETAAMTHLIYTIALISFPVILLSQLWFSSIPLDTRIRIAELNASTSSASYLDLERLFVINRVFTSILNLVGIGIALSLLKGQPNIPKEAIKTASLKGLKATIVIGPIYGIVLISLVLVSPSITSVTMDEGEVEAGELAFMVAINQEADHELGFLLFVPESFNLQNATIEAEENPEGDPDDSEILRDNSTSSAGPGDWMNRSDVRFSTWITRGFEADEINLYAFILSNISSFDNLGIVVTYNLSGDPNGTSPFRAVAILVKGEEILDLTFYDGFLLTEDENPFTVLSILFEATAIILSLIYLGVLATEHYTDLVPGEEKPGLETLQLQHLNTDLDHHDADGRDRVLQHQRPSPGEGVLP